MSAPTRVTSVDYTNASQRLGDLGHSRGVPLVPAGNRATSAASVHVPSLMPSYHHYHQPYRHHYSSVSIDNGKCCLGYIGSIAMTVCGVALALLCIIIGTVEAIPMAIIGVTMAGFGGVFTWINCRERRA